MNNVHTVCVLVFGKAADAANVFKPPHIKSESDTSSVQGAGSGDETPQDDFKRPFILPVLLHFCGNNLQLMWHTCALIISVGGLSASDGYISGEQHKDIFNGTVVAFHSR